MSSLFLYHKTSNLSSNSDNVYAHIALSYDKNSHILKCLTPSPLYSTLPPTPPRAERREG